VALLARRIARIARRRSLPAAAHAARREVALLRDERLLARGLAGRGPVAAGPFVGEVGYELLYWRPFLLRLLRRHAVDPSRVTLIGRGGSGAWYRDVSAASVDAFDLVPPEALREATERRKLGSTKQLDPDALDRELLERSGSTGATVIHPRYMYWRLRYLWEGMRDPADAAVLCDWDGLPRTALPAAIESRLPPEYIAVKAYSNDCMPDGHPALAEIVEAIVRVAPVVLLAAPVAADTHTDVGGIAGAVRVDDVLDPAENLAQQGEIVARSRALVSTYGGFSYLGAFLDVPTVAFAARPEANPRHELVLRAALPDAAFTRVGADPESVLRSLPA
jgi:hypothetical protein